MIKMGYRFIWNCGILSNPFINKFIGHLFHLHSGVRGTLLVLLVALFDSHYQPRKKMKWIQSFVVTFRTFRTLSTISVCHPRQKRLILKYLQFLLRKFIFINNLTII